MKVASGKPEHFAIAAVFCVSLVVLAWGAGKPGLATSYVDPVAKIQAQDEAVYGSTSLTMAAKGGWITPMFLGRYALYKPPMLYWLSALSVNVLGRNPLALRAPSLLSGAATVTVIFCWLRTAAPLLTAFAGALLLLSSHMFFVLSRVGLTDALLTFEMTCAMFALARDPRLESRACLGVFGCASGAAIMTKGVAGLFPLLGLGVFWLLSWQRPNWKRLMQVFAITAALALPWHLWQLYRHPHWFWAEYVLTEHWTWGFSSVPQTTEEQHILYYLKRLLAVDPILVLAALAAFTRSRPRVPIAWLIVVIAAVLGFQYRNTSYLMPMFPAMAVVAALAIPRNRSAIALVLAFALFAGKTLAVRETWGISFAPQSVIPSQAALDAYAAQRRGRELMLVDPQDQFYSASLDLPHVRYVYLEPASPSRRFPLDFEYLGVSMTAKEFLRLKEVRPVYAERLRSFDLDSTEPLATTIRARSEEEIADLIISHPETDFYVPGEWVDRDRGVHAVWRSEQGRVFLLSRP